MVKVLVIGASGYIGETLALELRRKGHTVYGLVRNAEKAKELVKGEVNVVVGDGTKSETLVEVIKKVDVIINSTMDFTNPETDLQSVNAISSAIEKAGGNKKRFIFVSGFLVARPSNDKPQTEETPTLDEEDLKKIGPEFVIFQNLIRNRIEAEKKVLNSKSFAGVIARAPMVYGRTKAHFTIFFKNAEEGKVVVYGDPNLVISFLHVDDFADGLIKIALAETQAVEHQIFSFAEPEKTTQKEVAYALAKGTGKEVKELKEESAPLPYAFFGRGNLFVDPSKAKKVLGWTAGHNLARDANVLYQSWKAYGTPAQW